MINLRGMKALQQLRIDIQESAEMEFPHACLTEMLLKTLRQIWTSGPYFPDPNQCRPPEGFKIHYKIQKNEHGWCFAGKMSLTRMLSNAIYMGHWVFKDTVLYWNHHPAIVDEATFFRAFNYLSTVNLDGTVNKQYKPNRISARPMCEEDRKVDRPLCSGLIFGQWEEEWKNAGTRWDRKDRCYAYLLYTDQAILTPLWCKKADYVDHAISTLLLEKLKLTFDFDRWKDSLDAFVDEHKQQQQLQRKQLKHLKTVMQNLLTSLESLTTPDLIMQIEQRYRDASAEHERLEAELQKQMSPVRGIEKIKSFESYYAYALEDWDNTETDVKRQLMHMFITRIEVTQQDNRDLTFLIYWQDGSTDQLEIGRVGTTGVPWYPQDNELLIRMVEEGADQVEVARTFPKRSWKGIFNKYKRLTGKTLTWGERRKRIKDTESYEDYLRRLKDSGTPGINSEGGL